MMSASAAFTTLVILALFIDVVAIIAWITGRPARPATQRRRAELLEHKRKSDAALAVWRYIAEHHGYDDATDRCTCGGIYLVCPPRLALHGYAVHLAGKSGDTNESPAVTVYAAA